MKIKRNFMRQRRICMTFKTSLFRFTVNIILSSGIFLIIGYTFLTTQLELSSSNRKFIENSKPYATEGGEFCVIPNAVVADQWPKFTDQDHVTLVTQSSLSYLNSAVEQCRLWDGPVSYALYAENVKKVKSVYLALLLIRLCEIDFRRKVSVHIFYPSLSSRCPIQRLPFELAPNVTDCQSQIQNILREIAPPRVSTAVKSKSYPVNVARNIAKRAAFTSLTLVADVELMPSENFVPMFMEFYKTRHKIRPKEAFVIPVFELSFNRPLPKTKEELYEEARYGQAVPFHYKRVAYECHRMPAMGKWWKSGEENLSRISIFTTTSWIRPCWEPVFLSLTSQTPLYDERFRGYGKNKIQQVYEMCRSDFTFHILDNAFLIHYNISTLSEHEWKDISNTVNYNNGLYERFRREMDARYTSVHQRKYCDTVIPWGTPFVKSL